MCSSHPRTWSSPPTSPRSCGARATPCWRRASRSGADFDRTHPLGRAGLCQDRLEHGGLAALPGAARYSGGRNSILACSPPQLRAFFRTRPVLWRLCFQSEWPLASGRSARGAGRRIGLPGDACGRVGRRARGAPRTFSAGCRRSAEYDGRLLRASGSQLHKKSGMPDPVRTPIPVPRPPPRLRAAR